MLDGDYLSPKLARVAQREKMNNKFWLQHFLWDVYVIQICQKQKSQSHFGGPVVHRQKNLPNLAEWAMYASWYLQNAPIENFILCNFESHEYS